MDMFKTFKQWENVHNLFLYKCRNFEPNSCHICKETFIEGQFAKM